MSEIISHSSSRTMYGEHGVYSPWADAPRAIIAHVKQMNEEGILLAGYETFATQLAASCLAQPEKNDIVSAIIDDRSIYITAILRRTAPHQPLVLSSGNTPLHLATRTLEIHSREKVELHTPRFSLITRTTIWVAQKMHQVADALFVRAKQASREVENTDDVHARHISHQADQSLIIHSHIGSISTSAALKIDGGQVHMG